MIALRRRDVTELNTLARALMDSDGRLGRERLTPRRARVRRRRPDRLPPQRPPPRRQERHPRHRRAVDREQRTLDGRARPTAAPSRRSPPATSKPATSATPTRSPATPQGLTVERAFVLGDDRRATPGMGLRRPLPRPQGDPPLHDRERARPRRATAPPRARDPVDRLADALTRPAAERSRPDADRRDPNPRQPRRPSSGRPAHSSSNGTALRKNTATHRRTPEQTQPQARRTGCVRPRPPRRRAPRRDQPTRQETRAPRPRARRPTTSSARRESTRSNWPRLASRPSEARARAGRERRRASTGLRAMSLLVHPDVADTTRESAPPRPRPP